ncbi:MAG: HNH endonuclease family protein [Candidatus Binataceae bacterium]
MLKLDYLYQNHDHRMHCKTLSVEHILPQNPAPNSQWMKDFSPEERSVWTDRLGNLVLITRRKNSSLGNLDYSEKKEHYFEKCIDTCPNSLRVLRSYQAWTPSELGTNHKIVVGRLLEEYGVKPGNICP